MNLFQWVGDFGKVLFSIDAELRHLRDAVGELSQEVRALAADV